MNKCFREPPYYFIPCWEDLCYITSRVSIFGKLSFLDNFRTTLNNHEHHQHDFALEPIMKGANQRAHSVNSLQLCLSPSHFDRVRVGFSSKFNGFGFCWCPVDVTSGRCNLETQVGFKEPEGWLICVGTCTNLHICILYLWVRFITTDISLFFFYYALL